jgi:integrase
VSVIQQQRLTDRVLKFLSSKHPDIYLGHEFAKFTSKHGEQFLKQLKRSLGTFEYLYCIRFLIKGLETGIENLGWTRVIPPHMPISAPREPARFTPLSFRNLNTLQPLHDAFKAHFEHPCNVSPTKEFGLILLSAVLYGGLLDKNWLTPLMRGLQDRVRMFGSLMWIDMQRPYIYPKHADQPEKRKHVDRRWFPDPLTQALIIRLHTRYSDLVLLSQKLDALNCIKTIVHELYGDLKPPTIIGLFEGASCYLALRLPSFLVSFASCKTISTSLPSPVWTRLLVDKAVVQTTEATAEVVHELPGQSYMVQSVNDIDMFHQERLRKILISILGEARRGRITCEPTCKKITAFFYDNVDRMAPVLQMLTQWTIEMLSRAQSRLEGRKVKNPLQPSAIATYLSAIDQELIACAGRDNISLYDPEELRDLYDDAIKSVKSSEQKNTTSLRLTQFHRFLIRAYGVPDIDMGGMVARKGPPEFGVDANLLSPRMFRAALCSLGWELPKRSRIHSVRCLITILGYRCGLRRHEALAIRIGDVMGETFPEIMVRTSYLNRLKTTDSARRLPLHVLLEPDELQELLHWKQIRIAEEGGDHCLDAPLFGLPGTKQLLGDNEVFLEIHAVLRQVSGDPGLRYHHLRHSFANRLLLVMLSVNLQPDELPEHLRQLCLFHITPQELVRGLFGNMNQGRQFLYGVSTLLGHADPATTLQSYFHLSDLLLGVMVRQPVLQPSLSIEAVMELTGLKRVMVFRTKAESACDDWKMEIYRERMARHASKLFPDPQLSAAKTIEPLPPQEEETAKVLPAWKIVQHVLKLYQVQGMPCQQIAERLRISIASAKAWCEAATFIRNLITKEGTPRHLTAWQRKQEIQKGIINLFPLPPDNPADKDLVAKILKKVATLSSHDLEVVRSGCQLFVERYSSNQGYVRFTDIQGAIAYKEFLKLIGIPDSMVYVSMFAKSVPARQSELDEQKQLLKKLGIAEDHLLTSGKRHVKYRRTHECSVAFMVARTDRTIKRKNKQVTAETLYGFRYAIYLLAIGLECINEVLS